MTLESRLRNGDSAIKLHSIFFPITNVLKNSLSCDEDYDLETVIRPNIHIELDGFKFLVMPLVVICSDFTGDAIVAKHAELTIDDCKFDFPCNLAVFQKEIECFHRAYSCPCSLWCRIGVIFRQGSAVSVSMD